MHEKRCVAVEFLDLETGEKTEYASIKEVAEQLGLNYDSLKTYCSRKKSEAIQKAL